MEGIFYALIPMFTWGSIGFVSNKIGGKPSQQTLGMTFGALLFSLAVWLIVRPEMTLQLWLLEYWVVLSGQLVKLVNFMPCNIWESPLPILCQVALNLFWEV